MNRNDTIEKIKHIKKELKENGFIIDGVFGSYARNEQTKNSDIDILYHLENKFLEKYEGFLGFKKLEEIKNYLRKKLNKNVDFAPIDNLSNTAKKYILKEVIYV